MLWFLPLANEEIKVTHCKMLLNESNETLYIRPGTYMQDQFR